ncbi:two component transcriptional regulator, LuxR family [Streptosporangium subroseum]|uniref:Two component transcriptional regulator, LuxR family n=1 Tax=Streptosporangium subroseum TaxID=106412 RepID=A0A239ADH2_9ACTN|nr:response regulator transcription factor [Streptosporangium subroseum]SNR93697.1 two component transcriptional regulator, LuxR family [Streptosporangium subroseum]
MIRVLIADDQQLVRLGLRMLCESEPDLEVVGDATNGEEAVRLAARLMPDVVLMDLRMPGIDGIVATRRIVAARPATQVLAVTTFDDDDHLYPVLAAGAVGFVTKDAPPGDLLNAIRGAARGERMFSQSPLRRLVDQAASGHRAPPAVPALPSSLTGREHEVLALVAEGLSNREIAERLYIGITTVKSHVASVMTKTGCQNRIALAVLANRAGR